MKDPDKPQPPDIQKDLATLGCLLLSLNMDNKQTLKTCIKNDTEAPPELAGYLRAIQAGLKYPWARDTILAALNAPQTVFSPHGEHGRNAPGQTLTITQIHK